MAQNLVGAGLSFSYCQGLIRGKTVPLTPPEVIERLQSGKSAEVRCPTGRYETVKASDLEVLHRLYVDPEGDELAARVAAMERSGLPLKGAGSYGGGALQAYRLLQEGKGIRVDRGGTIARSLDEIRFLDFLGGGDASRLKHPEVAASLKMALDTGAPVAWGVSRGLLDIYRAADQDPPPEASFTVARHLRISLAELKDPARVRERLVPLARLQSELKDPTLVDLALGSVARGEGRRPLEDRLKAACYSFRANDYRCQALYECLVDPQGWPVAMTDRLALADDVFARTPDLSSARDALVYAMRHVSRMAPPGREAEWQRHYLKLLGHHAAPGWACKTLKKLGPEVTPRAIHVASWKKLCWSHPSLHFEANRALSDEPRCQREAAILRLWERSDSRDAGTVRSLYQTLFPTAGAEGVQATMIEFERLEETLGKLELPRRDQAALECLETLRQEQAGGCLQGLTLPRCMDSLLAALRGRVRDDLLAGLPGQDSLRQALRALQEGPSRAGIEEQQGGVIVGGVRVPVKG